MTEAGRTREILKRSRTAAIAGRIAVQQMSRLRARLGIATIGATHRGFDLGQSVDYVDSVYEDYLRYGGLGPSDISGARVLEVGAGDNFGVAMRFLGAGAEKVVAVDRFATWRDPEQQRQISELLLERMPPSEHEAASSAINLDRGIEFDPRRLEVIEGLAIEEAVQRLGSRSFDLVISRAVMEHVYDVHASFAAMNELLRPGGVMTHKVDLSDHGLFTVGGHHPLTFLTVSDRVYAWMGGREGLPNRRRVDDYRAELGTLGYDATIVTTHVLGRDEELIPHVSEPAEGDAEHARRLVEAIRPRLVHPFRELPDVDLAVLGIFLSGRKPG